VWTVRKVFGTMSRKEEYETTRLEYIACCKRVAKLIDTKSTAEHAFRLAEHALKDEKDQQTRLYNALANYATLEASEAAENEIKIERSLVP